MPLSPTAAAAADAALRQLEGATAQIVAAGEDAGGWFSTLIGAESTAAALRSQAAAARKLLETLRAKRGTLASDDDARRFVLTIGEHTDTSLVREVAALLSAPRAVATIAAESAKDAGRELQATGKAALNVLRVGPYLLVGLAVLWVFLSAGGRRGAR